MLNSYNESKPKKLEPKHTALEIRMMNQLKGTSIFTWPILPFLFHSFCIKKKK